MVSCENSCAECFGELIKSGALLLSLPPGPDPPRRPNQIQSIINHYEFFKIEVTQVMVCVLEYGQNIGTLRNIFREMHQAENFAKQIIDFADDEYICIAENKWYCEKKNEYVEIKDL